MPTSNPLNIVEYRIKFLSYFIKQDYKTLLDISCGDSKYLEYWRWKGLTVAGTEFDDNKIKYCEGLNIPCDKLDLNDKNMKIDYNDNSIDFLTCTEVLEHVKNPKKVVTEMIRVAKHLVLITVPVYKSFYSKEHINLWDQADALLNSLLDIKHKDKIDICCDIVVTKPEDWGLNQRSFILALYKK